MKLSELKTGEIGVISKVGGHGSFRKRLIEMGFISGQRVEAVLNAPLKDPIEYEILGYKVSLRREEARLIEIVSEEEAKAHIKEHHADEVIYSDDGDEEAILNSELRELAEERHHVIRVALVGNPNCGKTSLFNIASGSHEHVGNYSGVTVDAKEGRFEYKGYKFVLVDLPGTYSLSAYSPEELYVRKNLIEAVPDVIVNVVDASNIERNLYLTTQLIDMHLKVVMALNMYDELLAHGDKLDIPQLSKLLGMPICPTICRDGKGVHELFDTVIEVYNHEYDAPELARHIHINHGEELERSIKAVQAPIRLNEGIKEKYSTRYLAIKYLEGDKDIAKVVEALPNRDDIITVRTEEEKRIEGVLGTNAESAIVDAKYGFIQGALAETYRPHVEKKQVRRTLTDKIDAVVTNKWAAFPIFIVILYVTFWATFKVGQYPMDWIDWLVQKIGDFTAMFMKDGWVKDLLVDGIIAGVGSVLVFLPNILILYFFISIMEDSGYMSRAAFIVDKLMHKIGLHGKSFIPMVMGFGCNVPAVMATRSIESRKARFITILIIPFMSCTGRLPVFVLLSGAFFGSHAALALLGIYLLGIIMAIVSAKIFAHFVPEDDLPFVMELPPYRMPTGKAILRHTWEKGKQYLQKMATTILLCSMIIWALGYLPVGHKQLSDSYIGWLGKAVSPALDPMGFDWKMDVSLITGIAAKELVVSTMGVMYSEEDGGEAAQTASQTGDTVLQTRLAASTSLPSAVAFMVFILLYFPCIATFVAIKNETGKWRYAVADCCYTMAVAWVMSFLAYHVTALLV